MSCPNYKIIFNDETKYVAQDITEEPVVRVIPARGEQGPQGPQGEQGEQGPKGEDGKSFEPTVVSELPETGEENKLYLTPKPHTTQTATGNPITATVTENAGKIESFKLNGDTFQQSYDGKNLFNMNNFYSQGTTHTLGNVSCKYEQDQSVELNGTVNAGSNVEFSGGNRYQIVLDSSKEYYLLVKVIGGSFEANTSQTVQIAYEVRYNGGSSVHYNSHVLNGNTQSFKMKLDDVEYITRIRIYQYQGGATFTNFRFQVAIYEGSSSEDFEPFVGGTPSPNPEYPQPIQTVTGTQTVTVAGKNLFDKNSTNITNYYPGTGGISYYSADAVTIILPVVAGETYTASTTDRTKIASTPSLAFSGEIITSAGTAFLSVTQWTSASSVSATAPNGAKYMYLYIKWSQDATAISEAIASIQVELGSTATPYAPYSHQTLPLDLGAIELCKLGDYQDYIYKSGDKWYVHKEVKKSVFDQNSGWIKNQYGTNAYNVKTGDIFTAIAEIGVISPQFIAKSYNGRTDAVDNIIFANSNDGMAMAQRGISIRNTAWSDLTSLTTWVTSNPVTVYYVLATPTDTEITNEALIAQLEAIRTASLQNGANTITNTATGTNLAGDMEIGYYSYNPRNRYDKWLWLDLNNNYEQLNNPDTAAETTTTTSLSSERNLSLTNIQSDSNETNNDEEQEDVTFNDVEDL